MNNVLRKRLIIRKMKRRIKRAERKRIKVKDLNVNRINIRDSVDYDSPRLRALVESMKENGWSPGKSILVNVNKDADGTVHIRHLRKRPMSGNDVWNLYVPK